MKRDQSRYINAILDTTEKFCSGCYRFRATKEGKWKVAVSGNTKRWICINCYNNITRR
jgi:molybdenum cofactor biosynthesis enzyme MoaA